MNASIEARKLSIIEYLAELEDENIIQQIENLLKPRVDFWDELSDREKSLIKQGLKDLEQGKRIDFQQFMKEQRNRQNS
jgi:phage antirepressor YoqD-like protein